VKNIGISHDEGQLYPKTLVQSGHNRPILEELAQDPAFSRISRFASGVFLFCLYFTALLTRS
jgi:hypothetical protein